VTLTPRLPPPSYSSPKSASACASSCLAEMAPVVSELVIMVTPSAAKPPYRGSFTSITRKSHPEQPRCLWQARCAYNTCGGGEGGRGDHGHPFCSEAAVPGFVD
jgi:hypothetical protein